MRKPQFHKNFLSWLARWRTQGNGFASAAWQPEDGLCLAVVHSADSPPKVKGLAHVAAPALTSELIADIVTGLPLKNTSWIWTMGREDYQLLVMDKPPISSSEMATGIRWALESRIDFPTEEAALAWMDIPLPPAEADREAQLYAVASKKTVVESARDLLSGAKIDLDIVDIRETAQRNIAALLEKDDECLALMSFEPGGALLTFTWRGELYLNRFIVQPVRDIALADELERERIFDRLASQYLRSLDFLARQYSFLQVRRLVIGPQPFDADAVPQLARALPHAVESVQLAECLDLSAVPEAASPQVQARAWTAIGAALRAEGPRP